MIDEAPFTTPDTNLVLFSGRFDLAVLALHFFLVRPGKQLAIFADKLANGPAPRNTPSYDASVTAPPSRPYPKSGSQRLTHWRRGYRGWRPPLNPRRSSRDAREERCLK